jgi:hypothetical protein
MRSSERTIKRLGEIITGDEAVSEDPGRLPITYPVGRSTSRPDGSPLFRGGWQSDALPVAFPPPVFPLLRPFIILSRVPPVRCPGNPQNSAGGQSIDKMVYFVERE